MGWEAYGQAVSSLCFNNSSIQGEYLTSKMDFSPSGEGCCLFLSGDFVVVYSVFGVVQIFVLVLVLGVISILAIILLRRRELVALILLCCDCLFLWLFLMVPWVGL